MISEKEKNMFINYSAKEINLMLSGMIAFLSDVGNGKNGLNSQVWYRNMLTEVIGKTSVNDDEILVKRKSLCEYIVACINFLYENNKIGNEIAISLMFNLNTISNNSEEMESLKELVLKINSNIKNISNYEMIMPEIKKYNQNTLPEIIFLCKIMALFDRELLNDVDKMNEINQNMKSKNVINEQQNNLSNYLIQIMEMSMENIGIVYMELSTVRNSILSKIMCNVIEKFHFLSDLEKKLKNKKIIIDEVITAEGLDSSVSLSISEIYDELIDKKINIMQEEIIERNRYSVINENTDTTTIEYDVEEHKCSSYSIDELILEQGENIDEFLEKVTDETEIKEVIKLLEEEALNGSKKACLYVAKIYNEGLADMDIDIPKAYEYYMKVSDIPEAQLEIGYFHFLGEGEVEVDEEEAFEWFLKAAEGGNKTACIKVGECYQYGTGVEADEYQAFRWYKEGADGGEPQFNLFVGDCYKKGIGVPIDYNEANYWYQLAGKHGVDIDDYLIESDIVVEYLDTALEWINKIEYMVESWEPCKGGAVNTYESREEYSEFMLDLIDCLEDNSYVFNYIIDNMDNMTYFLQHVFRKNKEIRIQAIDKVQQDMEGWTLPDININLAIESSGEYKILSEAFKEYVHDEFFNPDCNRVRENYKLETINSLCGEFPSSMNFYGFWSLNYIMYKLLYNKAFEIIKNRVCDDLDFYEEISDLCERFPIEHDTDYDSILIREIDETKPHIKIEYEDSWGKIENKYGYCSQSITRDEYVKVFRLHFENIPFDSYNVHMDIIDNSGWGDDIWEDLKYVDIEWGEWLDSNILELIITRRNESIKSGSAHMKISILEDPDIVACISLG